jgi:hypothetical protein
MSHCRSMRDIPEVKGLPVVVPEAMALHMRDIVSHSMAMHISPGSWYIGMGDDGLYVVPVNDEYPIFKIEGRSE